ncbi:MAG: YgfZ/GcvT domain-containing protein [Geminicoccaceae bacterium]
MSTAGYIVLADRGVLALRGADARSFLQGLISNDVEQIRPDQAVYGALLTPQGKFLFDFFIAQHGDGLLLETELARVEDLQRRLTMYRLRSKVEIADVSAGFAVAALVGDGVAEMLGLPARPGACRVLDGGLVLVDPRLVRMGARALLPGPNAGPMLAQLGLAAAPRAAYERLRLSLGVPDGSRDLMVDKATLLESGFEELNGVDFGKGCFVGQELTARMKFRGLVRKRLLPVTFDGATPAPGTIIRLGEREAGEMRSSSDGHGLALLRLEQMAKAKESGIPLLAGETEIVPATPDWAKL